jgi:hypothetical protein
MMSNRIAEIEAEIDHLVPGLLGPLRMSKEIDEIAFARLYALLEELQGVVEPEAVVTRSLAGLLFLIFTSILAEADHCPNPDPLLNEAWKVAGYVRRIFG